MLVTNKVLLSKAQSHQYAVGAFNVNDLEFVAAVIKAAELEKSPAIIQTTEGAINYAGIEMISALVKTAAQLTKMPVSLHLDHGKSLETVKAAIKNGYTSVMIDGSHLDFDKNVKLTKQVVKTAHAKGVSVEGELGTIGGAEDLVSSRKITLTNPNTAKEFVERTSVDALAIAIGTSHGAYKFKAKSHLDLKRLGEIRKKVKIPLVLHGASSIPKDIVAKAKRYGAKLGSTVGVSEYQVRKAVKLGICKVNIDSDLRLSFDAAIRESLAQHPEEFDPRKILSPATALITEVIRKKMRLLGSSGKAKYSHNLQD